MIYLKKQNKNLIKNEKERSEEIRKKEIEFIENAQSVRDYLKKNYVYNENDEESKKHLKRYLELITESYKAYNDNFCRFYKISPCFTLWTSEVIL